MRILTGQSADLAAVAQRAKDAMDSRNFHQAAALYGEPVRQLPQNAGLHCELAEAYRETGQKALANRTMRQFATLSSASVARAQKLDEKLAATPP
jgi:thioredoxin-like negative regulator of GroEL